MSAADRAAQRRAAYRASVAFGVSVGADGGTFDAQGLDISASGLSFGADRLVPARAVVALSFALPLDSISHAIRRVSGASGRLPMGTLRISGTVVASAWDADRAMYVHRVAFSGVPTGLAEGLHRFVLLTQFPRAPS